MKQGKAIAILLVVAGLGYYSWSANTKPGQSEADPSARKASQPEAVRLLEKAAAAVKAAKVVRYDADYQIRGSKQHIGGIVELDRNRDWVKMSVMDRGWPDYHEELFDAATDGFLVRHPWRLGHQRQIELVAQPLERDPKMYLALATQHQLMSIRILLGDQRPVFFLQFVQRIGKFHFVGTIFRFHAE